MDASLRDEVNKLRDEKRAEDEARPGATQNMASIGGISAARQSPREGLLGRLRWREDHLFQELIAIRAAIRTATYASESECEVANQLLNVTQSPI